jgi:hypothetical protein
MPGWLLDETAVLEKIVVPGNVMFTVPKKTDIDRVACKEPDLNMFIQKGIGNHISDCLLRVGINLNDQSINRSLARVGSITQELVTFDLSSASDSVTTDLVWLLLPECWYTLLDSVRSPVTIIDGEEHRNHMFSSMGNGFTFELESLIFLALTQAICYFRGARGVVSVYGDDIICPKGISTYLPYVFQYVGFSVNLEKSCTEGDFRESCGGHYKNGVDITPFYVKAPLSTLVDVIHVANKLREWAGVDGYRILDPEVYDIWVWLRSFIPKRFWGGWDTSYKYQLVTYLTVPPKGGFVKLFEESDKRTNGAGGYFHWLNATWDRREQTDGVITSSRTVSRNSFRVRRSRRPSTVAPLSSIFYQELDDTEYVMEVIPHKSI